MRVLVIAAVMAAFGLVGLGESGARSRLRIERVEGAGAGVWLVVQPEPVWANSLLVEAADGTLVLCDTPMTEAATVELLVWAGERFGERRWVVVNGHFHPDCTGGNAAMIEAGAEVWGSEATAGLLAERGRGVLDSLAETYAGDPALAAEFRATRVAGPTRVFTTEAPAALPIEGERVEVVFPGAGHAPDNVVTHFVDRGLVFAGCLCFSASRETAGYVGDADFEAWPGSLDRASALGARVVVPGHGKPGGAELWGHTAGVLARHVGASGSGR